LLWTALAVACANLLLAYLVALALWPTRIPVLGTWPILALAGTGGIFTLLAFRGWLGYLRARRAGGR
jgi:hypothetical protein